MKKKQLPVWGALLVEGDLFADQRGSLATFWEEEGSTSIGLPFTPRSLLVSRNTKRHTLRGMHFQHAPYGQNKLVTCVRGAAHDVILDLRRDSPTFRKWHAIHMDSESAKALYIPAGCAHGFLTLEPDTWITYLIEGPYIPASRGIVRWNDPLFEIRWPEAHPILSDNDRSAPDFLP
jgi:dTDP-4-dehydrorhamnose 3,5-epimerase